MSNTIAAVATGNSAAGIGVIRISGDDAIKIASKVFSCADRSSLDSLKGYQAKFGFVNSKGEKYDNAVALVFRQPKSYTGENVVEISVHGGVFIVQKTLEAVFDAGASPAKAGEFTKRAFLNGKLDLTQAESVATLISAEGEAAATASYNALTGTLSKRIDNILNELLDCSALINAWVDYPDEEIPELESETLQSTLKTAINRLNKLIDGYDNGQIMTAGVDTAIVGKPNVGKSSLMNVLSGNERSIVTDVRGTTRDIVENTVRLGGLILRLADTAGIRESGDVVESIGIERAKERLEKAQLVLAVFDETEATDDDDIDIAKKCKNKNAIAIINKSDLNKNEKFDYDIINKNFKEFVLVSAKLGNGIDELEEKVKNILGVANFNAADPILANERQKQCCKNAKKYLDEALSSSECGMTFDAVGVMIDSACDELLSLTGKKATEEVVNNIFSKFCVGK